MAFDRLTEQSLTETLGTAGLHSLQHVLYGCVFRVVKQVSLTPLISIVIKDSDIFVHFVLRNQHLDLLSVS